RQSGLPVPVSVRTPRSRVSSWCLLQGASGGAGCAGAGAAENHRQLDQVETPVGEQGQRSDHHRAHENDPIGDVDAGIDDVTQPAAPDEGAQGAGADDEHQGGAQAGEDERRGERQLDAAQRLPAGHPHAPGGADGVGVDALDAHHGVAQHGKSAVGDEGDDHRGDPDAEERVEDGEHSDAGDRLPQVGEWEHKESRSAASNGEQGSQRDAGHHDHPERDTGEEQGPKEAAGQEGPVEHLRIGGGAPQGPVDEEAETQAHRDGEGTQEESAPAARPGRRDEVRPRHSRGHRDASRMLSPSITPRTVSASRTVTCPPSERSTASSASRRLASAPTVSPGNAKPLGAARRASRTRSSAKRRTMRPSPRNWATKGEAGWASSSTGRAYCSSTPPWESSATRSPIRTASSMSWVTKTMVLWRTFWRRRSSFCRRTRTTGSMAPKGSSISRMS